VKIEIHLSPAMYRELVDAAADVEMEGAESGRSPESVFARECVESVLADRRRMHSLLRRRGDLLVVAR